jgi:drug/metabolite transporter (DMT)-like permease
VDGGMRQIRTSSLFALVMLVAQFLLGMAVNLFVKIPDQHPGSNPPDYFSGVAQSVTWSVFHGNILLAIHSVFGLVLVVAAVGTLVQGIQTHRRGIVLSAVFGFIGVLLAGLNGGAFLNYHEDVSSMAMAVGFAIAVVSYSVVLYLAARNPVTAAQSPA